MDLVRADLLVSQGILLSDICLDEDLEPSDCPNCRLQDALSQETWLPSFGHGLLRQEVGIWRSDQSVAKTPFAKPPQRAPPSMT